MNEIFGEPIHSYSRAQAIEDGVLIDVTELAKEAGIKYPTAITCRLWNEVVVPDDTSRKIGQSENGRLWDVLMIMKAVILKGNDGPEVQFRVRVVFQGNVHRDIGIKSLCGPGDNLEPVITIMMPDED